MSALALRSLVAAALACALALAAPRAAAKDLGGKLAVGLERTIGGVSGAAIRYWPGQAFGIVATFGLNVLGVVGTSTAEEDGLATAADVSAGITYNFARSLHANLGVGLRVALGYRTEQALRTQLQLDEGEAIEGDVTDAVVHFNLEIPIVLEFFLSDSFSISAATGIVISRVPRPAAVLETDGLLRLSNPGSWSATIGAGSTTGSLGIMYYF